jgi:hypothetical protein
LRAELRRLRKQYQEQTEMSKREFMNVHSKKVSAGSHKKFKSHQEDIKEIIKVPLQKRS